MRRAALTIGLVAVLALVARQGNPARSQDVGLTPIAYLPVVERHDPPTPPPVYIANADFEAGPVGWGESSTHFAHLITNEFDAANPAHGGAWAAWLGGADEDISVLTQQITVPVGSSRLVYWYRILSGDECGLDTGIVQVNGVTVLTYQLCHTTNMGGWAPFALDLRSLARQSVLLSFRTETDWTIDSSLLLDDFSFQPDQPITPTLTPTETLTPSITPTRDPNVCAAEYPTVCIPPPPPDLDCPDIPYRNFTVLPPDRHDFDGDGNGRGCESNISEIQGTPVVRRALP